MKEKEALLKLRAYSTPILFDAIEKFNVRARHIEYTRTTQIECIFPHLGPICGYATTVKLCGNLPAAENEACVPFKELWRYVYDSQRPSIIAAQDLDDEPRCACAWGDYAVSIFKRLGCEAVITNGYVRDVDAVRDLGFHYFAKGKIVGHGYVRLKEIDVPVQVAGVTVSPGDILHADEHGFTIIPREIELDALIRKADEWLASEAKVISYCKETLEFSLENLFALVDEHESFGGHLS